ncbi:MAG: rhomboid family intramembrane serine protease [Bacteroidales bacterium]|nr:rhomboid family intramembrane serine protease [Bacteroidales bacterium]
MNRPGMNNFGGNFSAPQKPFENLKGYFRKNNMLVKLIIINVAVWLIIMVLEVFFDLFNTSFSNGLIQWLAVPADPVKLIFRPWTLFTYMFLHFDFWHILFNMLWLYWFGRIFLEYLNERQLLATYIFGGLAGAILYILSFNIFPKFQDTYLLSMALGASASVMAIVVAISFYVPNYRIHLMFLGPVKIYYIAVFSIILDIMMIRSSNSGGHLAHLGGAVWGFYYIYMLRKGMDFSTLINKIPKIKFSKSQYTRKKTKFKNVYSNTKPVSDEDYNFNKKQNHKKIDEILDKISKSGYESLTKEEKELLFRTSNKNK